MVLTSTSIKRCIFIISVLICHISAAQQIRYIQVYFLYGSKPAKDYKKHEPNEFGGLHGGHVSIGIDSFNVSFHHVNGYHIFSKRKNLKGIYEKIPIVSFLKDTTSRKYTIFEIPLDSINYDKLRANIAAYLQKTPYDYAFYGMRCAAASYDMLSHAGILKQSSRLGIIYSNFYPRLLRKKLFRLAETQPYIVKYQQGSKSRIWEND